MRESLGTRMALDSQPSGGPFFLNDSHRPHSHGANTSRLVCDFVIQKVRESLGKVRESLGEVRESLGVGEGIARM